MRFLPTLFTTFALFSTGVMASELRDIQYSTYLLYEDGEEICSGTFVSTTQFLTASHCYEPGKDYTIVMNVNDTNLDLPLKLQAIDEDSDLVVFKFNDDEYRPYSVDVAKAPWVDEHLEWGTDVLVASYPNAELLTAVKGTFIGAMGAPERYFAKNPGYEISVTGLMPGSSGGGIYMQNDNGAYIMIGVLLAFGETQPSLVWCANIHNILKLLD